MHTTNDRTAIPCAEHGAIEDDGEELCSAYLSDEDILLSFLREGCDLDGTPLQMATQRVLDHQAPYRPGILH
jgi:hypothetical protein